MQPLMRRLRVQSIAHYRQSSLLMLQSIAQGTAWSAAPHQGPCVVRGGGKQLRLFILQRPNLVLQAGHLLSQALFSCEKGR